MTTTQNIDNIAKASGGITALVDAVGLQQAVQAVMAAGPEQLSDNEKDSVVREIFVQQLNRAADAVKGGGLTPEVIALLQQLLSLMQPQAASPPDAPGVPAAGEPPAEQKAAKKAAGASFEEMHSAMQAKLAEQFTVTDDTPWEQRPFVMDIFPEDSTMIYRMDGNHYQVAYSYQDGDVSFTGSPTEMRRTYVPVGSDSAAAQPAAPAAPAPTEASAKGDDAAKKNLPTAQKDPLTLAPVKDPLSLAPQKKEEDERARKGQLPAEQKDPLTMAPAKDPGVQTPQKKSDPWAWSRQGDLGKKDPPKPKLFHNRYR